MAQSGHWPIWFDMSAFRGKAEVPEKALSHPLMTQTGHCVLQPQCNRPRRAPSKRTYGLRAGLRALYWAQMPTTAAPPT